MTIAATGVTTTAATIVTAAILPLELSKCKTSIAATGAWAA
jgi:hypothetical protein